MLCSLGPRNHSPSPPSPCWGCNLQEHKPQLLGLVSAGAYGESALGLLGFLSVASCSHLLPDTLPGISSSDSSVSPTASFLGLWEPPRLALTTSVFADCLPRVSSNMYFKSWPSPLPVMPPNDCGRRVQSKVWVVSSSPGPRSQWPIYNGGLPFLLTAQDVIWVCMLQGCYFLYVPLCSMGTCGNDVLILFWGAKANLCWVCCRFSRNTYAWQHETRALISTLPPASGEFLRKSPHLSLDLSLLICKMAL